VVVLNLYLDVGLIVQKILHDDFWKILSITVAALTVSRLCFTITFIFRYWMIFWIP